MIFYVKYSKFFCQRLSIVNNWNKNVHFFRELENKSISCG